MTAAPLAADRPVPLDEIIVTRELAGRPPSNTDQARLKQALLDLGSCMAEGPGEVLPRFVDFAMEMAGGVAAGISVLEPADGTAAVFRWHFLRGSLAAFEGATTPRNDSPCGVTLDAGAAVLARHAERYYAWIADAEIVVPEVLLVPLRRGADGIGTLWIVSDRVGHFNAGHVTAVSELSGFVSAALQMFKTEQQLKASLAVQAGLAQEMSHRVKNVFSIVDGMIQLSARNARSPADLAEVLSGRVRALARAHGLVRRSFTEGGGKDQPAGLEALLRAILLPHDRAAGSRAGAAASPFTLSGPGIGLGDHAINNMALIFHELVTNAAKYGALTTAGGTVEIAWSFAGDDILVRWTERGGPSVEGPPTSTGFGTQLVARTVETSFLGTLSYEWNPSGLGLTLRLPRKALTD
ncbi:sensor histidine kinase [Reyranella sp.]|uniref:sensor histidine kinase n=1 Tax=Reyranella sp. TaxID=1929291 RepID=UPI003BAC2CB1